MKKIVIILSILFAIAAGIYLYLRKNKLQDFEPLIKQKLSKLVTEGSHGLYHLDIESLVTDVIGSKVTLVNAHLSPDTLVYAQLEKLQQAPNDIFDITISHLSIDHIVPADFIANKAINLNTIFINNPVIKVWHKKHSYNAPANDSSKTMYQQIQKDISSVKVDSIILQNVDFIYTNKSMKNKETRLMDVKFFFTDILLDSSTQFDQQRFLFARNCMISLKNYSLKTSDSLYRFAVGDIQIETKDKAMQLKTVTFQPRLSVEKFYKRIGHEQDRFEMSVGEVNFREVNWWAILAEESFFITDMAMRNAKLKIFRDKSQPDDTTSKVGKYPHQLLMKLTFPLKLDTVRLNNVDLSYTELNPKTNQTGTLYFDNIHGMITNVTNDAETIVKNRVCTINAQATFMKHSPLNARFTFDLPNSKKGSFSVTASLGTINNEALNEITIPLALVKLNSLTVKSLDANIKGDNYQATGTVKLIYNDLKISALKAAGDTLKKRGLLSFVANTFIIKKDNPLNDQPVRVEHAEFQRDTRKSFFNLVWKTIFTGAGKTVGYNAKK